jgi:HSP20 family protein
MFFAPLSVSPVRVNRALNGSGYVPSIWAHAEPFDRVFSDVFETANQRSHIESDETFITISMDVPGLAKDQLTIGIEGRIVRISSKDDAPRTVRASYKLGSDIDAASSEAKLEHGVLTVKFKKVAPESRQTLLTIS